MIVLHEAENGEGMKMVHMMAGIGSPAYLVALTVGAMVEVSADDIFNIITIYSIVPDEKKQMMDELSFTDILGIYKVAASSGLLDGLQVENTKKVVH